MSLVARYRAHFLMIELMISLLAAILFILALLWISTPDEIEEWIELNRTEVYPVIATVSGTLLGFVVAGVSVVIAFSESKGFGLLKQSKHYETVFQIYLSAIKYLSAATVSATLAIFARDDFAILVMSFLMFSIIAASLRLWRCLWVLREFISIARGHDDLN